jgi:hypothetical protein
LQGKSQLNAVVCHILPVAVDNGASAYMSGKRISGLVGIVVGGIWFVHNLQFFKEQGFVAIGMPLVIFVAGMIYFFRGSAST